MGSDGLDRGSDSMKSGDFAAWLSAIAGMSSAQRAEAFATLEKRARAAPTRRSAGQGEAQSPRGCAWRERRRARRGSRVSPLRGSRDRWLGPFGRAFAISLQELRAHVQRADQNADGASAQEGALARSRAGDDRGHEPGEDRGVVWRSSDHGVPLAASVFSRARRRQASNVEWNCRGG